MALDSETLSPSEFLEYMKPEKLSCFSRPPRQFDNCNWVLWSEETDDKSEGLENLGGTLDHSKKIKDMLLEARFDWWWCSLIQFWEPKRIGDRCFLTTSSQPFALYELSKNCGSYRKQCLEERISVQEEGDEEEVVEEALGPIGRAFRNKLPESSPRVRLYSPQEFPLVEHASLCCSGGLAAFPVFEIESQTCVGVLEFLGFPVGNKSLDTDILSFERQLEEAGLALNHPYLKPVPRDHPHLWNEIKKACKVVARTHPLLFVLAFIPSAGFWENDGCGRDFSDSGILKLAFGEKLFDSEFFDEFIDVHKAFHLQKGKGVSGKAFASLRSCFCRNICDFTIAEFPLVHYARVAKLNLSFAICLRTTKLEKGLLVLEFFLSLELISGNLFSSLQSLLTKLKEHIPSFEIVAEDVPIEELFPKVRKSSDDDEVDNLGITQHVRLSFELPTWQGGREYEQLDPSPPLLPNGSGSYVSGLEFLSSMEDVGDISSDLEGSVGELRPSSSYSSCSDLGVSNNSGCDFSGSESGLSDIEWLSIGTDVSVTHAENSTTTKRRKREAGGPPPISRDAITQHFGKSESVAASCLGVHVSTLKRYCRYYGISCWPRSKKNKGGIHTVSAMQNTEGGEVSISVPGTPSSLTLSSQENLQSFGTATPNIGSSTQNFSTVSIKVRHGGHWIRFPLRPTATVAELEGEVAKRLNLNVGSFRMTYDDEEGDPITITCDKDLQHCVEIMTSIGRTTIKMAIQLISD